MMWGRRCGRGSIHKSLPRTCKGHRVCVQDVEKGDREAEIMQHMLGQFGVASDMHACSIKQRMKWSERKEVI